MLAGLSLVSSALGYDIIRNDDGNPYTWTAGTVAVQIKLGETANLSDGSSFNSSTQTALNLWNAQLGTLQFSGTSTTAGAPVQGNSVNEIGFDSKIYGTDDFDENVLAVATASYFIPARADGTYRRSQSDIIVNSAEQWDSYRGSLSGRGEKIDVQRVMLHELGHLLSLDHPDEAAPPQDVSAVMNSHITDLDTLAADDITGARSLYGAPGGGGVAPSITAHPGNQSVTSGNNATFSTNASGTPSPTFLWQRLPAGSGTWSNLANGGNYSGATTTTLTVSGVPAEMNGDQFRCVATNAVGSATSNSALLSVSTNFAPSITSQPADRAVAPGAPATFSVTANGTPAPSFQWQVSVAGSASWTNLFNDGTYSGVTSQTLTIPSASFQMNSNRFRCVASNVAGSAASNPAQLSVLSAEGAVTFAAAGYDFSLIVRADGGLWSAGSNPHGQLGDGTTAPRTTAVKVATNVATAAASSSHSLFIKADGSLWAMGYNSSGQLGDGTKTDRSIPVPVATSVVAASAGSHHSLFIKADGSLWGMGEGGNGELGNGITLQTSTPVKIAEHVIAIAAGYASSLFVTSDGSLWVTGYNPSGQLGTGSTSMRDALQKVASNVTSVATYDDHSVFVKSDGSWWGMGYLYSSTPANWLSPIQLATGAVSTVAGDGRSFFIKEDHTLWASGYSAGLGTGGTNAHVPTQLLTNVMAATAGYAHSLCVRADGSLWATGMNSSGAFGIPAYSPWAWIQVANGVSMPPQPPSGLTATFAPATGAMRLSWNPAIGASHYEIWRSTTNSLGSATRLVSNASSAIYYDRTVTAASSYFYWVKAINSTGGTVSTAINGVAPVSGEADFNGDGKPDLLWQNTATGQRSVWLMDGVDATAGVDLGAIPVEWVIAGAVDFTGDGKADLLWQNTVTGQRSVWVMDGTTVLYGVDLGTVPLDWWIAAVGDFNADNKPDILWTNTATNERSIWLMNGTSTLYGVSLGIVPFEWTIAGAADFNLDNQTDILWSNVLTGERSIWLMNGTTATAGISLGILTPRQQISGTGDFNNDGHADILLSDQVSGARSVWLMNGTTIASTVSMGTVGPEWILNRPTPRRVPVDFNADSKSDIVWQNTVTGERAAWLMNGTTALSGISLGTRSIDWEIAATGDFNFDGRADLLWQNTTTGERSIRLMNGATTLSEVALSTIPTEWKFRATGDFNLDGAVDLVLQNTGSGECVVWFMNGTTPTGGTSLGIQPLTMQIVGCGDFNADSKADLVWTDTSTGIRSIWLMNGTTLDSAASLGVVAQQWALAGTGDFDQDGNADLLWQNTATGERSIWLMSGTSARTGVSLGSAPTSWSMRN